MERTARKMGTKSGWRQRDKKYRLEQNAKARANRARRARAEQAEHLFNLMARWGV